MPPHSVEGGRFGRPNGAFVVHPRKRALILLPCHEHKFVVVLSFLLLSVKG